jgi:hypothetical protein
MESPEEYSPMMAKRYGPTSYRLLIPAVTLITRSIDLSKVQESHALAIMPASILQSVMAMKLGRNRSSERESKGMTARQLANMQTL